MRLKSCHIINFGKFSDKDIFFDGGLTSICRENGYGKTTLAAFLEAMFFGMDSTRKNSKFNDRAHFCPFNGGAYGGNVVFEWKGNEYKIEREFDKTSNAKDLTRVYKNGILCEDLADNIGEVIFEIDRESFERTVFLNGRDFELSSTDGINTKLKSFLEGNDDESSFESAIDRLEKKSKEYKKQRLSAGLIQDERETIQTLKEKISNLESVRSGLVEKYEKFEEYNKKIDDISEKIAVAQTKNVVLTKWTNYERMLDGISEKEERIAKIKELYPLGLPQPSEIEETENAVSEYNKDVAVSKNNKFSEVDRQKLSSLKQKFVIGVPDDSLMESIGEKIDNARSLEVRIKTIKSEDNDEEEAEFKKHFAAHKPTRQEVEEIKEKFERYRETEQAYNNMSSSATIEKPKPVLTKTDILLLAVCSVMLLVGVITALFSVVVGVVILALGLVGLVAEAFLYLNKKSNLALRSVGVEDPQKAQLLAVKRDLTLEISNILAPYAYSCDNGVQYAVTCFLRDNDRYIEFLAKKNIAASRLSEDETDLKAVQAELKKIFNEFGIFDENYFSAFTELKTNVSEYFSLKRREEAFMAGEEVLKEKINKNSEIISNFFKKYGKESDRPSQTLKSITEDLRTLQTVEQDLKKLKEDAEKYKQEAGLTEKPDGTVVDIEELNKELSEIQKNRGVLALAISEDETEVEKEDSLKSELEERNENLKKYRYDYEILIKTIEFLTNADRALKEKYIKPIRDSFKSYSDAIEKVIGEKVIMDSDFNIRFDYNGIERSDEHLSSGQKSVCALCFRLALIDNMYSNEKPFLILDDPFVNLDKNYLEKAKSVLLALSKKTQIIYFSCHESRNI